MENRSLSRSQSREPQRLRRPDQRIIEQNVKQLDITMTKVNSLLTERLKSAKERFSKMTHLVEMLIERGTLQLFRSFSDICPH